LKISSICSGVYPDAYNPPTKLPILVPAIKSIGILCFSIYFNTPICAVPLDPPPLRASPMAGRFLILGSETTMILLFFNSILLDKVKEPAETSFMKINRQ